MIHIKLNVCGGCNAKIGPGDLNDILKNLSIYERSEVLLGFDGNEDGAVIKISDKQAIVTSVDFFPPMLEEPYIFGKVAAVNALSDLYAMGATPISAMNIVCFPEEEDLKMLGDILRGGADVCKEAKCCLTGGHSIHDPKIKYGLSVTGIADLTKIVRNNTPCAGDALILTKPLGVSLLMNAYSVGETKKEYFDSAVNSMLKLNKEASEILSTFKLHSMTDVTGFGLAGHLTEMCKNFSAHIISENLPVLKGAKDAAQNFLFTAGAQRNRHAFYDKICFIKNDFVTEEIMFDPQTSGGLLAALPQEESKKALSLLKETGHDAAMIGTVKEQREYKIYVR